MEFDRSPFVLGLASVFAGLTAVLGIFGVVGAQPIAVVVAVPFGVTSYIMFYHGTGRLARAAVRRGERVRRERARGARRATGAGPRERTGPRTRADRRARADAGRRRRRTGSKRRRPRPEAPSMAQARSALGVSADAGEAEIKAAYRERVKEVHPDRGGDEETFKRVTAAYDRLT